MHAVSAVIFYRAIKVPCFTNNTDEDLRSREVTEVVSVGSAHPRSGGVGRVSRVSCCGILVKRTGLVGSDGCCHDSEVGVITAQVVRDVES